MRHGMMPIGVYITFRILDVADLTVDGLLATGGAVCVMYRCFGTEKKKLTKQGLLDRFASLAGVQERTDAVLLSSSDCGRLRNLQAAVFSLLP